MAVFYDKLLGSPDFANLPSKKTGRLGYPKDTMLRAFAVMKCESFAQVSDLVDYLNNNLLIAHYCGFDISKPLPSQWTFTRFIRELDNVYLKEIMADLVRKLYDVGVVDASFIGLDSTHIMANTKHNNPKSGDVKAMSLSTAFPACRFTS